MMKMKMRMKMRILVAVVLVIVAAMFVFGCSKGAGDCEKADLVIKNGRIFTSDPDNKWAQAVAVKDKLICYVGDDSGVQDYIDSDTKVVDAGGNMVVPGFVDNHCHILWMGALQGIMKNVYDATSLQEMSAAIIEYGENHPNDPFVMSNGWRFGFFPDGMPDATHADEIISDRPLLMWSSGGHTGLVNTQALALMQERNPAAFEFLTPTHDEVTGKPTGLLLNFQRYNPMDFFSSEEMGGDIEQRMFEAMGTAIDMALEVGVTTLNDMQIYENFIPKILKFYEQGGIQNVRIVCSYYIDPDALDDEAGLKKELEEWKELGQQDYNSHLFLGESVKMYMDGVIGTHTSFMLEPYSDMPDYCGEPYWSQKNFNRVMEIIDGMELQSCVHATGDGATRSVIDGYEHVRKLNGVRDSRHRIEHAEFFAQEDIDRIAPLGIYAAMQPSHFYGGDEMFEAMVGPERVQRVMPWKSLQDAGVELSAGSDWTAAPFNPMFGLLFGSTRINSQGNTDWGPEQKLPIENVLMDYTISSAKAMRLEDSVGSIEVGKYGDFAIFSVDLLDISTWGIDPYSGVGPNDLDGMVIMTIVGGEVVYEKP
ncbi:MAG: amidohydrolase [Candidatus Eremiobacteraeota bacterium]|nr:amidohydrolase [Candidatus Eremiobacteraeota bacterium]